MDVDDSHCPDNCGMPQEREGGEVISECLAGLWANHKRAVLIVSAGLALGVATAITGVIVYHLAANGE